MKIKLSILTIFAALLIFGGGARVCRAQEEPVTGGYAKADAADKEVVAAANFAVKKRSRTTKTGTTLIAVKNAEVQVVAGLNYQICMKVRFQRKSKKTDEQFVQVVVYRNLKNVFSLTSWAAKDCAEQ
jgi:hypothetical protein